MAAISLLLSSTLSCPSTICFYDAEALTICMGLRPWKPSFEPLTHFSSMLTNSLLIVSSLMLAAHSTNKSSNNLGRMLEKTLLRVSWDGMLLGSFNIVLKKPILVLPKSAIESQDSAPQIIARMERTMISLSKCFLFRETR